jgi:hypothetical protein
MFDLKKGDVIQITGRIRKHVEEYEEEIKDDDLFALRFLSGPLEFVWVTWEVDQFDEPIAAVYLGHMFRNSGYVAHQNQVNPEQRIHVAMVCRLDNQRRYRAPFEVLESQIIKEERQ